MLITYYGVVSSIFSFERKNDISEFFHFLDFCDMVQMKEIFNVTPALISDMPVTRNFAKICRQFLKNAIHRISIFQFFTYAVNLWNVDKSELDCRVQRLKGVMLKHILY